MTGLLVVTLIVVIAGFCVVVIMQRRAGTRHQQALSAVTGSRARDIETAVTAAVKAAESRLRDTLNMKLASHGRDLSGIEDRLGRVIAEAEARLREHVTGALGDVALTVGSVREAVAAAAAREPAATPARKAAGPKARALPKGTDGG